MVVAASKIWKKRKLDLIFGVSQLEDLPGYRPPLGVYSFFFFDELPALHFHTWFSLNQFKLSNNRRTNINKGARERIK